MALNFTSAVLVRDGALNGALDTILDGGKIRLYDGTQPLDPNTAITTQVMLAEFTPLATPAWAAAASASKALNAVPAGSIVVAGTTTWGSFLTSGNVRKCDFSVGTSGANLNMNAVVLAVGAAISITSFTVSQAA